MSRPPNGYLYNASIPGGSMTSSSSRPNISRPRDPGSVPSSMSRAEPPMSRTEASISRSEAPMSRSEAPMSRAERFEDEKKRIIASCFNKYEGEQLLESYITHIRIQEDSQNPSTPPPPDSPAENKKPRLIVIAVRSTGRVRMHKARENNNGSFSIGKTWNLEELSAIETFASTTLQPQSEKEAQYKSWAGTTGFTVTITKPYYWQAGTGKEKDFFIASTVKIYKKYTKGQVPELRGFDDREKALILGLAPPQPPQQGSRTPNESRGGSSLHTPLPFVQREQSRDESRYRQSPGPSPGSGPTSRLPSESPARFANTPPSVPPYPVTPIEQQRSPSKDDAREFRLATVSNDNLRSQSFTQSQHPSQHPGQQPLRSPLRPEISSRPSVPMPAPPSGALTRPRNTPPATDGPVSDYEDTFKPTASSAERGAQLFQNARQQWMGQHRQETRTPPQSQVPQLQPIDTTPRPIQNGFESSSERVPFTAGSEVSAVDLGDAAAVGALTSYWGPEPQAIVAPAKAKAEPQSPPTPERSKRRPQLEPKASESSLDLRPAPLNQSRKQPEPKPQPVVDEEPAQLPTPGPEPETPLEPKPLQIHNKSETHLPMPGAFSPGLLQVSPDPSPDPTPGEEKEEEEQFRPGLGPMFKKKAIADRFKKAANAASAFKPRPGGAAEKILRAKAEREGEPDGITGVVPRPQARQDPVQDRPATPQENLAVKSPGNEQPPTVEISAPRTPLPQGEASAVDLGRGVELKDESLQLLSHDQQPVSEPEDQLEQRQIRQPHVRIKRRSVQQEKYLAALEIDRQLLEGRGLEFEMMLSDFGWNTQILQTKQLMDLEHDIRREHARVEAGSWLSYSDTAREERVGQVETLLDKAIAECDELEGLLTLYHVELSSLNDDIAFIEAQSQGLQVQSANQKLLQTELQGLVDTMSLDRRVMEPLRYGDLSTPQSLDEIEQSLVRLYQAMLTIDPNMRSNASARPQSHSGVGDNEASSMAALREKKAVYERESTEFCQRLMQFLDSRILTAMNSAKGRVMRPSGGSGLARLQPEVFNEVRSTLWMYSPLLLFTKELNTPAWQTILRMYYQRATPLYFDALKENVSNWKRAARTPTGDEGDVLFTAQEKEEAPVGMVSSARKLTVKRSHTLAKTLRNASGDKHPSSEPRQAGALMRAAAFAGAIDEMAPLLSREQNFIVDLFHATSLESADFIDAVSAAVPSNRRGTNLLERKSTEPDREMAGRVANAMGETFGFFLNELSSMLDWTVSDDPLQGVGVMASLSRHAFFLQETSQEFLLKVVQSLSSRLQTRFSKFVEEQIRAIEDTKVKIKKRKGVIAFIKIFPHFSAAVENIFAAVAGNDYDSPGECVAEVRRTVDDAYERINRAMFDSLKVIAKESPVASAVPGQQARTGDDPEDKEMLNYHILLIENMNHYIEEVDDGSRQGVLADWKGRALMERMEALTAYVSRVIRRPLGRLLDFIESAEAIIATSPGSPSAIAARPSYSRKAMRVILAQYDSKEIRRGIDTLRKRIEKHFGDADEEAISRGLVGFVCKECERSYEKVLERTEKLVHEVYPPVEGEKLVEIDFTRADIQAAFRR